MTQFYAVVKTDELPPGERIVVEIDGTWILVLNVGGDFFAVEDMCSHEEYEISGGVLTDYSLECPKHSACFDIRTGKALCPPAVSPIHTFPIRVEGDDVLVGVGR